MTGNDNVPVRDERLNDDQQQRLLRFVRDTAKRLLSESVDNAADALRIEGTFGGVFVTFWRGDKLRGCVGRFARTSDLPTTVQEVTESSLADRRFETNPITAEELPALTIEVSILSDTVLTETPLSLIPGVHGIVIQRGAKSGCFLPKVAADRDWSAKEFLSQCCTLKAGLPRDAWRDPETEVWLFTAESFAESRGERPPPSTTHEPRIKP